jgi:hypothetical protein
MPSDRWTAASTSPSVRAAASSTHHTPSMTLSFNPTHNSRASRVLPTPPGPVMVTNRWRSTRSTMVDLQIGRCGPTGCEHFLADESLPDRRFGDAL